MRKHSTKPHNTMEQINEIKSQLQPKLEEVGNYLNDLKTTLPKEIEAFLLDLKTTSKDDLLNDFNALKITPGTITVSIIGLTSVLIIGRLLFSSLSSSTPVANDDKKKKKKKVSRAQKINKQIQEVLDHFESKWVPEINEYFANYKELSDEKIQYQYKYFQEMLLKELLKLDGIETLGNEIIRENRRKVIQFIQDHQKRLDSFMKEIEL